MNEGDEIEDLEKYLLGEVDQYEKDFHDMFAYLNDVEEMLHGNDVDTIREMMDISDKRINGHISQYDQMQSRVISMSDDAVEAMQSLAKFSDK